MNWLVASFAVVPAGSYTNAAAATAPVSCPAGASLLSFTSQHEAPCLQLAHSSLESHSFRLSSPCLAGQVAMARRLAWLFQPALAPAPRGKLLLWRLVCHALGSIGFVIEFVFSSLGCLSRSFYCLAGSTSSTQAQCMHLVCCSSSVRCWHHMLTNPCSA